MTPVMRRRWILAIVHARGIRMSASNRPPGRRPILVRRRQRAFSKRLDRPPNVSVSGRQSRREFGFRPITLLYCFAESLVFPKGANEPYWIAWAKREWRHILRHDSTGSDNSAFSNAHIAQNNCLGANQTFWPISMQLADGGNSSRRSDMG